MARETRERRISEELLDELLAGEDPAWAFHEGGLIDDLKKAVAERALDPEMNAHQEGERESGSPRNGHSRKRVPADDGAFELEVSRDQPGRFEPRLVERYCRRLPGFDDKVISMYARSLTTREICGYIEELCSVSVSAEVISKVTDAVLEEFGQWQSRPLEEVYAIIHFDAVRVNIRHEGLVRNKAVCLAIWVPFTGWVDTGRRMGHGAGTLAAHWGQPWGGVGRVKERRRRWRCACQQGWVEHRSSGTLGIGGRRLRARRGDDRRPTVRRVTMRSFLEEADGVS